MRNEVYAALRSEVNERIRESERIERLRFLRKLLLKNRDKIEKKIPLEDMRKRVREIKESSIRRIEELLKIATDSLQENGANVYFAKTAGDALKYCLEICDGDRKITTCGTDMPWEINLYQTLMDIGKELHHTDFGYTLWQYMPEERISSRGAPMVHLSLEKIAEKISAKLHEEIKPEEEAIANKIKEITIKFVADADVGITGANAIAAAEGSVLLLHDTGNITKVLGTVPKHLVIAGIEKIVPDLSDAINVVRCQNLFMTWRTVKHMNIVSGPTEMKEIGKKIMKGFYGPKEMHVVIVDNGRTSAIKQGFEEWLYCLHCSYCLRFCSVYDQIGMRYGYGDCHPGGIGVIRSAFTEGLEASIRNGLFLCALCGVCREKCPLRIDAPKMIERLRERALAEGLGPKLAFELKESIAQHGNPLKRPKLDRFKYP